MPANNAVSVDETAGKAFRPASAGTLESAIRAVNSLGIAFATFQLFADPQGRDAFGQAVDELGSATALGVLEVTDNGFRWGRSQVPVEHPGVSRLAVQLFLHNVAGVRLVSSPSAADLVTLFDVIRHHPEDIPEGAGLALANRGVSAIRLLVRGMLHQASPDEAPPEAAATIPGRPDKPDVESFGFQPESFAAALLNAAGNDRVRLTELVVDRYLEASRLVDHEDVWAMEEIVHTFVDTFFYFPREFQAPILAELLVRRDLPPFRMFLDQFARHELRELAPLLDDEIHPLLLEYAKVAAESDERLDELHILLTESTASRPIGALIEHQIGQLLNPQGGGQAPVGGAVQRLQSQVPSQAAPPEVAADVLFGLLEMASSAPDLVRRFRIWARKVGAAIEADDVEAAKTWVSVVFDNPELAQHTNHITTTLRDVVTPTVVAHLVEAFHRTEMREDVGLARVLPFIADAIVDRLGDEPDQRLRRTMIDMLTIVARRDAEPIVRHLDDPRWYLVRNLVLVVGRSRKPELAEVLRPLAHHPDPRVRRETLRSIHALGGGEADVLLEGLGDPDQSVRAVAATMIRSAPSPEMVPLLAGLIETGISTEAKCDVIALLGYLPSWDARTLLEKLAAKRMSASPATRALRTAAQAALEHAP